MVVRDLPIVTGVAIYMDVQVSLCCAQEWSIWIMWGLFFYFWVTPTLSSKTSAQVSILTSCEQPSHFSHILIGICHHSFMTRMRWGLFKIIFPCFEITIASFPLPFVPPNPPMYTQALALFQTYSFLLSMLSHMCVPKYINTTCSVFIVLLRCMFAWITNWIA